jgi:uncharacterized protein
MNADISAATGIPAKEDAASRLPSIRIDADACPAGVRIGVERLASRYKLPLIYYIDDSHELCPEYGEVRQVGQGHDAVDLMLANQIHAGDIVVTQDYGLGALAIARKAQALHPGGMAYTADNIDRLLLERHLAAKSRQAGERGHHAHKRKKSDDIRLVDQLKQIIEARLGAI